MIGVVGVVYVSGRRTWAAAWRPVRGCHRGHVWESTKLITKHIQVVADDCGGVIPNQSSSNASLALCQLSCLHMRRTTG